MLFRVKKLEWKHCMLDSLSKSYRLSYGSNLNYVIKHLLKLLGLGKLSKVPGEEYLSNKRALDRWMFLKGTILKPQEKTILIQNKDT